jgi:TPR repeat protein
LVAALNTDFDWLREHTRYLQRATGWDRGGRPANRLLSGDDIAEAKAWAARRPKNASEPTALHLDFIRASEEEAEARSSAQRKQLEATAAAQAEGQKALHEAEEAQRKRATNEGKAEAMFNLGLLYANGQGVTQDYVRAREWYEKAADNGNATAMLNLGQLYEEGWGVAQDYGKAGEWYEKAADKGEPRAKAQLEQLPIRAADAGRYAEALQLQEALAVKVEKAETKREGNPAKETAQALQGVAWRALFAREFTKALTASDRAHALLPDDLGIETNRAHAFMFVERGKESKALYLAHKGKPVSEEDAKPWERAIVEDFAEFRKAGLTHPMMADIEKELGVSP